MKTLIISLAALAAVTGAALAQKAPDAAKPSATIPIGVFYKAQQAGQTLAKDRLLGAKVVNKDGESIGTIEDLILDPEAKVLGVIMGVGGFLGAGEKQIAVRLGALKITEADGKTTVALPSASKEVLAAVGPYERLVAKKTILQKASEAAKEGAKKAGEAAAAVTQKAKDAVTPAPATTPAPVAKP
jgi:PRC-barrel domain